MTTEVSPHLTATEIQCSCPPHVRDIRYKQSQKAAYVLRVADLLADAVDDSLTAAQLQALESLAQAFHLTFSLSPEKGN